MLAVCPSHGLLLPAHTKEATKKNQVSSLSITFIYSFSKYFPSTYFVPALFFKVWTERSVVSLFYESARSPSPNLRDFETHTCEVPTLSGCRPSRLRSSSTTRALSLGITSQPVPYVIPYLMGAPQGHRGYKWEGAFLTTVPGSHCRKRHSKREVV